MGSEEVGWGGGGGVGGKEVRWDWLDRDAARVVGVRWDGMGADGIGGLGSVNVCGAGNGVMGPLVTATVTAPPHTRCLISDGELGLENFGEYHYLLLRQLHKIT